MWKNLPARQRYLQLHVLLEKVLAAAHLVDYSAYDTMVRVPRPYTRAATMTIDPHSGSPLGGRCIFDIHRVTAPA